MGVGAGVGVGIEVRAVVGVGAHVEEQHSRRLTLPSCLLWMVPSLHRAKSSLCWPWPQCHPASVSVSVSVVSVSVSVNVSVYICAVTQPANLLVVRTKQDALATCFALPFASGLNQSFG